MKPLRAFIVESSTEDGTLSLRLKLEDRTATPLKKELAERFSPGDPILISLDEDGEMGEDPENIAADLDDEIE